MPFNPRLQIIALVLSLTAFGSSFFLAKSNLKMRRQIAAFEQCEEAISKHKPASDLFSCPVAIRQLAQSKADLKIQLDAATQGQSAAIARAIVRTQNQVTRKARDAQIIAAAPRGNDGIIICDANCLRQRSKK